MPTMKLSGSLLVLSAVLSGCGVFAQRDATDQAVSAAEKDAEARAQAFASQVADRDARRARQIVGKPWVAGASRPLSRDVSANLPAALRESVSTTMHFADMPSDLRGVASRITTATGIPVSISPDALLPQAMFGAKLGGNQEAPAANAGHDRIEMLAGTQPLATTLDQITRSLGVYWRYDADAEAIRIYRTDTRVFTVAAPSVVPTVEARLGRTTSGESTFQNTSNAGFKRAGETNTTTLDAVKAKVAAFMTRSGVIAGSEAGTNTIVVTDTKDVLDRIGRFIDDENRSLSRVILFRIDELVISTTQSGEAGIDWSAIYRAAGSSFGFLGPSAGASSMAGALSATVGRGPWSGTEAVINMLASDGRLLSRNTRQLIAMNRQPQTFADSRRFEYPNKVTTSALGTSTGAGTGQAFPQLSIEQKQETVGVFLTLQADAQSNGNILLSFALDNTTAQPLTQQTFGQGASQIYVQQATIDGKGIVQQLVVRAGVPTLLTSYQSSSQQYDQRRVGQDAPLAAGGATNTSSSKQMTVYIVSATVQEGV